jgi:ABC-2 type transport system permease protein
LYFWFSGLFIVGVASLRNFFGVAPLLFMFLAPAITMRLVAEERKTGTIELLMTLPVKEWEIIIAKWLAAVLMMSVGLAFTLTYPITLTLLAADNASIDYGPIIGGYLGCVLMAGAFAAVGLWASAMSENQIVAFIFGLVVSFALWVLDKTALIHPGLGEILEYLSVNYHFESISRGVLDTRDLLYYATLIFLFLGLSAGALRAIRSPRGAIKPIEIMVFATLVLVNIIGLQFFARFDLTRDKQYTLSEATRETMSALDAPVKVTAYFSKDLPPPFSQNTRYTMDLLEEYRAASNGQLSFELIDPQEQETQEDKEIKKDARRPPSRRSSRGSAFSPSRCVSSKRTRHRRVAHTWASRFVTAKRRKRSLSCKIPRRSSTT